MLRKILRNGMAGALVALLPVTSSIAATRPSAAVPMVSSAASSAAMAEDSYGDHSINWVAIGLGVAAIAIFALLVLDNDHGNEGSVSAG
jgi:hypothetical protein